MSRVPFNDVFKGQQKKLVRSTFKKAVINQVYVNSNNADVYFAGNPQTIIKGVPLAAGITPSLVMVGDKCRVDVFDETNPNDMVVAYIYGRNLGTATKVFTQADLFTGSSNPLIITHGLGQKPDIYGIVPTSDWVFIKGSALVTYEIEMIVDATNITLVMRPDNTENMNYFIFAVVF
jgi:hypothetical protein